MILQMVATNQYQLTSAGWMPHLVGHFVASTNNMTLNPSIKMWDDSLGPITAIVNIRGQFLE